LTCSQLGMAETERGGCVFDKEASCEGQSAPGTEGSSGEPSGDGRGRIKPKVVTWSPWKDTSGMGGLWSKLKGPSHFTLVAIMKGSLRRWTAAPG
ncbi:hypothetical protein NDU88_000023, partial [Pleurodeles waltl]